jgi:vitamin B12 transporter
MKIHRLRLPSLLALTLAGIALPAAAQETRLDTLVITAAGLTPFEQQEIGRSYTVLDGARIEATGTPYVADVLRQIPGLAVSRTGSVGGKTQIRIRGAEANHVLVLIDGISVSENSDGEYDFGRLQVANIDRIEVLRGPQSAFWGANAMSGVINIVTKSGGETGLHGTLATEFGTDGTKMTSGFLAYGQENFDASGSVTLRHTDGFNISYAGDELDGATHIDADVRFRAEITPQLTLDGSIRHGRALADADEQAFPRGTLFDTNDISRIHETFGAVGLKWVSEDGLWFQNARISGGRIERQGIDQWGDNRNTGDRYKASYQVGHNFDTPDFLDSHHTVTLGYDMVEETFQQLVPTLQDQQQRAAHSVAGEYRGTYLDQLYLTAAVRHDFNESFADSTTYSLSGAWEIPDTGTRLHASAGTGSTNPTFYEQFGYNPATFTPNPGLIPETGFGWDFGIEQSLLDGLVVLDATYFNQNLENKIETIYGATTTVENLTGISTRHGVELSANLKLANGLTAGVTYTYLDARDPSGAREIRRPEHSGAINLAYTLPEIPLTLHGEVVFTGDMPDALSGTTHILGAHAVINGGLSYRVSDQLDIYGRVHNLFDAKYQEVYGFNTQGRAFYAGARAKF